MCWASVSQIAETHSSGMVSFCVTSYVRQSPRKSEIIPIVAQSLELALSYCFLTPVRYKHTAIDIDAGFNRVRHLNNRHTELTIIRQDQENEGY